MIEALAALKAFFSLIDVASVVLGVMLFAAWSIIRRASKSGDYSFARMLKNDAGNEDVLKLSTLASFAISTWCLMVDVMRSGNANPTLLLIYLSVWASVPVGMSLADALKTKWSQTPTKE